jgi:hypothetical protein
MPAPSAHPFRGGFPNVCRYGGGELSADDHVGNLADYLDRVETEVITSARARSSWKKEYSHERAVSLRAEALSYAEFFSLPIPNIDLIPDLDSEGLAAVKAREAKKAAQKAEQTRRERAEALARQQELVTQWRAGLYSGCFYDVPVMLRIEGDEVVTSRGARFPISHGKRGLAFVRRVRELGQAYVRNGHTIHLGPYSIDRIEADGTVKAGCHIVSWQEIERLAPVVDSFTPTTFSLDSTAKVSS